MADRPCSRRWLVTRLPLALVGAPFIAEAQRTAPVSRVGYLGGSREAAPLVDVLRDALRDLGYIEGRNIVFTIHWGEPDRERLRDVATELLRSQIDVIVAGPDPAITAATRATKTIPIVMVLPTDPVGSGFITSLARPGGNVTGLTLDAGPEIHGKRLEFLKAAFPHISHVAVLRNPTSVASGTYAKVLDDAAAALKVALVRIDVRGPAAFEAARRALARHPPQALLVEPDPFVYSHRTQVVELVAKLRVPTVYAAIDWVNIGGLMAYAANRASHATCSELCRQNHQGRQACRLAGRATDDVRVRDQQENRQGRWPDDPASGARASGSDHRVTRSRHDDSGRNGLLRVTH